jgi:hypothetical protein
MWAWQSRAAFDNVGTCLLIPCLDRLTVRAAVRDLNPLITRGCLVMSVTDVVIKEETWQSD